MLAIRLQRIGRKGYPVYRVAIQEAQRHPSSGRVVAYVGSYNPHTKEYKLDKEKIEFYLKNGAQPTPRVVKLLALDKIAMPDWVHGHEGNKQGKIRFEDKLRKNRPAEEKAPVEAEAPAEEVVEAPAEEAAEPASETPIEEAKEPEVTEEVPAEAEESKAE